MHGFPPDTFRRRRAQVLERLQGDALVLPASPVRYRSRDTEYRYRPDSELFWLTGVTDPGVVAVLRDQGDEDRFVLFVRSRDREAERWSGPRLGPEEAAERFGADRAFPLEELEGRLSDLLKGAGGVYFRLDGDRRTEALIRKALRTARSGGARKGSGPRRVVDPGEVLDDLRLVKDPEEQARLREAARLTVAGFREAAPLIGPGRGEWEVEAALEAAFRRGGALGPAFGTIVAAGANACVLHYVENGDTIPEGALVLVDAGAEAGLYAGDVTRTFPASGAFQGPQREVYEVVEAARRAGVAAVSPGATAADVQSAVLEVLVEGLVALGVLEGPADERIEDEGYKEFYPHQASHWLGLDTHDPGDYARDGRPRVLEPGMALTVEPGLYFPPDTEVEEAGPYRGMGVRIEDDVLVTPEGREVLTADLPTDPDEVAAMV